MVRVDGGQFGVTVGWGEGVAKRVEIEIKGKEIEKFKKSQQRECILGFLSY